MWLKTAGVTALATCLVGLGAAVASADPTTPTPAPPTAPKTTIDAGGTYAVGTDVAPGVYSTAGPVDNGACYWKIVGNPDGATKDNGLTKQPQTIQIAADDTTFKTNGCQPWQLSDATVQPPQGMAPVVAGLQLQAWMAQLNANAAASGQAPPP